MGEQEAPMITPTVIDGSRRTAQRAIFAILDTDGDGRLDSEDMFKLAKLMGFEDDRQAWLEEFESLCENSNSIPEDGIGEETFVALLDDECSCTDHELLVL